MFIKYNISQLRFEPYADGYSFLLAVFEQDTENEHYIGIDIPCKNDEKWRFFVLFDDHTEPWELSVSEREFLRYKAREYCESHGYTYKGTYFEK